MEIKNIIGLLFFLYLLTVITYPVSNDEAIFSTIGSNLDNFELYNHLIDDKPPGIFAVTYLISQIPLDTHIMNRIVVFLTTIFTIIITMLLSEKLFGPNSKLIYIPVLFILFSIPYLGGIIPLTETFENLFIISGIFMFFNSKEKNYELKSLLISALLFFIGFQIKQTALIFLAIPFLFMVLEKKFKNLIYFFGAFTVFFLLVLLILSSFGILDSYLDDVWLFHFERGTYNPFSLTKHLAISIVLPLLFVSLPGAYNSLKSKRNLTLILLFTTLIVLLTSAVLIRSFTFRFYFLELVPILLLFAPITFQHLNKFHKLIQTLVLLSVLFLILFFGLIFVKTILLQNFQGNAEDATLLTYMLESHNCTNNFATITYWYLISGDSPNLIYSLNGMGYEYIGITPEEFKQFLANPNTCFANYQQFKFYSLEQTPSSKDPLFSLAEEVCECEYSEGKTSNLAVCYSCFLKE